MTVTAAHIDAFIRRLAEAPTAPDAYNQFASGPATNALRRANLRRYLGDVARRQPQTLLVMEAPGYRGSRLTGVPVTSRNILLNGIPELAMFGVERGYQDVPEPGFERIRGEQSATIVWGTLRQLGIVPLIWNAFPFHPHRPDQPLTNRRPRAGEIALGTSFLRDLLESFAPSRVVAVGNVAYETLTAMQVPCLRVRHPAQGGKNDFVSGLVAHLS